MTIHIYFKDNEDCTTVETSRVTVVEKHNSLTPGQVSLVLGTTGSKDFQYYPFDDVRWFWVEEN